MPSHLSKSRAKKHERAPDVPLRKLKLGMASRSTAVALTQRAELVEDRFGVADLELARRLDVQRLDDAVIDQHRVALRADTHAACNQVELEPEGLDERRAAVGHHPYLAGGLLLPGPGAHDEGVVDRDAPDLVHVPGLELLVVGEIAGDVLG